MISSELQSIQDRNRVCYLELYGTGLIIRIGYGNATALQFQSHSPGISIPIDFHSLCLSVDGLRPHNEIAICKGVMPHIARLYWHSDLYHAICWVVLLSHLGCDRKQIKLFVETREI